MKKYSLLIALLLPLLIFGQQESYYSLYRYNMNVINPAFDMTPPELISGIITENGIAKPPFEKSIRQLFAAN